MYRLTRRLFIGCFAILVCSSFDQPLLQEPATATSGYFFSNEGFLKLSFWKPGTWPKFLLGVMYEKSQDLVRGERRTVEQYRLAAEQGDARAQFILALLYTVGQGVRQDRQHALQWYHRAFDAVRKPAERGAADAQIILGLLYSYQRPVRNYPLAAEWFHKAAEQGDIFAQLLLANMYKEGTGVPESDRDAFKWYTKAFVLARKMAGEGDMMAQLVLGMICVSSYDLHSIRIGDCVLHWHTRAAEQGNAYAQWLVGDRHAGSAPVEATKWWLRAAMQGDAEAQYNVGNRYYRGRGLPQDYVRAHVWLNLAVLNENGSALFPLERLSRRITPGQLADAQMLTQELIRKNLMIVVEAR